MNCETCITSTGNEGCGDKGGCASGGCNKLNVFDWLANMQLPTDHRFDVIEVRFKNGRKEFFRNSENLFLETGDPVIVDVPNGHHLGFVSLQGELVRLQMRKKSIENNDKVRKLYRKAHRKDIEKFNEVKTKEQATLFRTRKIIDELNLAMKLTDVEYQADNSKATFFYSADERVDFRELIKRLAGEFKTRIEMRQISLRQEAGYLGGIGSCGRELCCSTWLSSFASVSTGAARYQNLSLNPSKLSGQCGRLKCCLNYELDTYKNALKDIPTVQKPLLTEKGEATLQKTDIFRKIMWFSYENDNNWHAVDVDRVVEILALNEESKKPASLLEDVEALNLDTGRLNNDLEMMDRKYKKNKKPKRNKKRGNPKRKNRPSDKK
ncbi:MAG: regulatory iron-sulfur-containing complex subunit RicT [Cyclobacteriaceae bacterium]|nr:regulatory iron-sulfur-containing complex subunit RicT [Cyclobacteriaceae bacterium]